MRTEANSRYRALLVMEARRAWVEEVSEAMASPDGKHLVQIAQELRGEVELEEVPVESGRLQPLEKVTF